MAETDPSITIDESLDHAERSVLEGFVDQISRNKTFQEALNAYGKNPEVFRTVVNLLTDNPEQLLLLKTVSDVLDSKLDKYLNLSDEMEDNIALHPQSKELQKLRESARTDEEKEKAVLKTRIWRLGFVATTVARHRAA